MRTSKLSHARFIAHIISENIETVQNGAEIGVWQGNTSLELLRIFPKLHLLMVDRYEVCEPTGRGKVSKTRDIGTFLDIMRDVAERSLEFNDRRTLVISHSVEASTYIANSSLDFVYVDADHSYEGVQADLQAWHKKIKVGGLFCGHDYGGHFKGVERAVNEFAKAHQLEIHIHKGRRVWWTKVS